MQRLQRQVEQQGAEIRQLRQQLAAAQQGGAQQAAAAASAPAVAAGSVATPASSRMGQDLSLQVPGSSSTPQGGGSWVSFSATGGQGDAPTPTLLQPAAGGSFKGSSRLSASGGAAPAAAGNVAAAGATPASSTVQLEQQLRYKLDLSMCVRGRCRVVFGQGVQRVGGRQVLTGCAHPLTPAGAPTTWGEPCR